MTLWWQRHVVVATLVDPYAIDPAANATVMAVLLVGAAWFGRSVLVGLRSTADRGMAFFTSLMGFVFCVLAAVAVVVRVVG